MFSFRRKSRKPETDRSGPPFIRASPSLPELSSQGIPWPENFIDTSYIQQQQIEDALPKGKPDGGTISSLYMQPQQPPPPPSAFETRKQSARTHPRYTQRKLRTPTTFNVMVAGAQGTGKTSLLRLLLDTADISPTATPDQRAAMDRFLRGSPKRTESIQTACVEICESRYDRVLLSVIDTPGLDLQEGHELKLERQVTGIVKYLDAQFADTLNEESKVVRQSKGDQHVHLCIYMIDPKSIITASHRRALSALPPKNRSTTTINHPPDLSSFSEDATSDDTDDEAAGGLSMSPADIRVIRRLSARANVLPIIARADSLTDDTLAEMKRVVRQNLHDAGLDFGVFGPVVKELKSPAALVPGGEGDRERRVSVMSSTRVGSGDEGTPVEERRSRGVIKLRAPRLNQERGSSRSRSRMSLSELAAKERAEPDAADEDSVASVRFSANIVAKTDLSAQMPFALICPEGVRRRRPLKPSVPAINRLSVQTDGGRSTVSHGAETTTTEDGYAHSVAESTPATPTSPSSSRNMAYLAGPPADLKGVFTRKFRWGTVDVLNPDHCDFAAMRTAVLSTHLKMLKIRTNEVLYEKFRTEKLLAKRATRGINEDQTRKLLQDLGLGADTGSGLAENVVQAIGL